MKKSIQIGEIIKKKVEERNMNIAEFAAKIYCDRTTVYDLFKRNTIDINRLLRISEVLDYDFIGEIYLQKEVVNTPSPTDEPAYYLVIPVKLKELKTMDLPEGAMLLKKESLPK